MKTYNVLSPVRTESGLVKAGTISLSDSDAEELLSIGVIGLTETQANDAPTAPAVTTDPAVRKAAIVEAIGKLDTTNTDQWLQDGRPDAASLSEITGWNVGAAERNDAWASMQPAA
jgi:hypothetical protein